LARYHLSAVIHGQDVPGPPSAVQIAVILRSTRRTTIGQVRWENLFRQLTLRLSQQQRRKVQWERDCTHDGTGHLCLPCCVAAQIR
jgi:hypothetical protein